MPSANILATIAGILIALIGIQATTGTQKTEPVWNAEPNILQPPGSSDNAAG